MMNEKQSQYKIINQSIEIYLSSYIWNIFYFNNQTITSEMINLFPINCQKYSHSCFQYIVDCP